MNSILSNHNTYIQENVATPYYSYQMSTHAQLRKTRVAIWAIKSPIGDFLRSLATF